MLDWPWGVFLSLVAITFLLELRKHFSLSIGWRHFSLGTKGWRSYVSWSHGSFSTHLKHIHLIIRPTATWKPHRPSVYEAAWRKPVLPTTNRWRDTRLGVHAWPVSFAVYWYATCYGCVAAYSDDYANRLTS